MAPSELYSFGSNASSQLALGHSQDVSEPAACLVPSGDFGDISQITAGGNHTLVLSTYGFVLAAGDNSNGRCGPQDVGKTLPVLRQISVSNLTDKDVSGLHFGICTATWEASFLVTRDLNKVLACGSGSKGELGLGPDVTEARSPTGLPNFPPAGTKIVDIASCMSHVVVVLSDGSVYGWGNGRKGQLGHPSNVVWSPRKIQGLHFDVKRAVCGREFTYLVGDPETGAHWFLGPDKWGVATTAPPTIQGWKDVHASWGSIFVLLSTGRLISWGRNDHGQLAPENLSLLRTLTVGSEHVIALTEAGEVLAWGWGEHGNCGRSSDTSEDVKKQWNVISMPHRAPAQANYNIGIGAGCATSWIWIDAY